MDGLVRLEELAKRLSRLLLLLAHGSRSKTPKIDTGFIMAVCLLVYMRVMSVRLEIRRCFIDVCTYDEEEKSSR